MNDNDKLMTMTIVRDLNQILLIELTIKTLKLHNLNLTLIIK